MSDPLAAARRTIENAAKATPGEWKVERRWSNGCEIVPRITCNPDDDRGCGWIADMVGAPYLGHESTLPNADFVAHVRTDAPLIAQALLDATEEIGRLTEALTAIRQRCGGRHDAGPCLICDTVSAALGDKP